MTLNKAKIKAVLFDLDGTLIDSDDVAVEKLAKRLHPIFKGNAKKVSRRIVMFGETPLNTFITFLDILHLDEPMMRLAHRKHERHNEVPAGSFRLIPGVDHLIDTIKDRYKIALVTTRGRRDINHFLRDFPDIAAVVETSCGLEDTVRLKPHPEPVRLAAQQLGLPPENCLMVGDTTVDVKSGRRAGAQTVAVLCGFGERRELQRAKANLILESTADLLNFL